MDNIRAVIGILFGHVSEQQICDNMVYYNNVPMEIFTALANSYMIRYSNDEIRNLYSYLKNELKWVKHKVHCENEDGKAPIEINVFDVLQLFNSEVLIEENGNPVCQYIHFLRWNDTAREIGEDTLTTSYLAFRDARFGKKRTDFFWKPVIGHNSKALNRIMEKGIAENHFHLKGSAPLFHVSWISLMNDVENVEFKIGLEEYDKRRLKRNIAYVSGYTENSLYILYLRAACIRMYLFEKIKGINQNDTEILKVLRNKTDLQNFTRKLQGKIEYCQLEYGNEYDYTMCELKMRKKDKVKLNWLLAGERWLLYQVFSRIYNRKKHDPQMCQIFYWYLIIKNKIRAEMVQINENVGFDNFLLYQNRKSRFIKRTKYEEYFTRMAVRDTICNQHIERLEARISPENTMEDYKQEIERMDFWIEGKDMETTGKEGEKGDKIKEKYFYVIHFLKEKDDESLRYEYGMCRHAKKRREVEREARALADLRENDPNVAQRIRGIDASSSEIVCRPETFAQAFRYLKAHNGTDGVPQLRCTYHVGEDFLDVLDGLRAIDETILFLNLKCGDRLGHALALGVDIDEWYSKKANSLLISRMGYLDNLVWAYSKIRKYHLSGCEDAILYIQKRYDEMIEYIYKRNIRNNKNQYMFSINCYYDAWKLRGDNPENYSHGYFYIEDVYVDEWNYHAINREFPRNYSIRYNQEVAYLYYLYHFNSDIKKAGDEMIEVQVNPAMIKVTKLLQKKMQEEICERGIAIETNPSSNRYIGTFKRYDEHPIKEWYNLGLTSNPEELEKCPQLLVSINTDDQGVFNTYLENEYAYLALALEKAKNSDGTPKYKRTMILQWLDNIRKMGMDQSFGR